MAEEDCYLFEGKATLSYQSEIQPKKTAEKSGIMTELTQKKFIYSAKKFLHRRERQHKKRRRKIRNICYICHF